jgi:uncharacterized protein (TIGR03086 family)
MNFFDTAADRFTATVEGTADWSATSPCEGWSAADVVDHVVDTQRDFLGRFDLDLGARPSGAPGSVWASHLSTVRDLVTGDLCAQEYDGFFARITIGETLDRFYGFDLVVHGWDLGSSQGAPPTFTDTDMELMEAALAGFGDHAYDDGVFKQPVDVPADADRQTRLLARMGRRA